MNRSNERSAAIFRRKVRELLDAGMGISQIAKTTGKSYAHTKRIVEQEVAQVEAARKGERA